MERAAMTPRTVFRYGAEYDYPVLVIDPGTDVLPSETLYPTDSAGQRLHANYRHEVPPTAPGMLGIIYTEGTDDDRATALEALRELDPADVLDAVRAQHALPEHAVAVLVYPHSIASTWR